MTKKTVEQVKIELFEAVLDGDLSWEDYINWVNFLVPMTPEEYERRLALAWVPSMLLGCAP